MKGICFLSLPFGISLPQSWLMDLASMKDPAQAYEAMTRFAQTAECLMTLRFIHFKTGGNNV